jgi:hypothetical protein
MNIYCAHPLINAQGHHRTSITIPERHLQARQPALIARTYESHATKAAVKAGKKSQQGWRLQ